MHHLRFALAPRFLVACTAAVLLGRAGPASAAGIPRSCGANGAPACVESCALPAKPPGSASELFLSGLRTLPSTGHHAKIVAGKSPATALSQFRVFSRPLTKEAAARWRQNGMWAGPCAGLAAAFGASAVDDKDPRKVVDLYELRYRSETTARRVATLLASSWNWNGHPSVVAQRGPNVMVAEGRYGAWSTLEGVATHFRGAIPAASGSPALGLCATGSNHRPTFQADGLVVYVLGFAPSGELAWLEAAPVQNEETVWTLHVTNLVDDRELVSRVYRTAGTGVDAFCAEHRAAASELLAARAVTAAELKETGRLAADSPPLGVSIRRGQSAGTEIVMEGPLGTKVLGRLPASITSARTLGLIQSPFEERVAVVVLAKGPASARAAVRVLGGRLDKRWTPRAPAPPLISATTAVR